jgi:DNA-binding beta-propeller fold protein YncE
MKPEALRPSRAVRAYGLVVTLLALGYGLGCGSDSANTQDRQSEDRDRSKEEAKGAKEIAAPLMNIAANDTRVRAPMDATPSPDGARVFYTALRRDETEGDDVPGVFAVDADGGDIATLATGGPLAAPVGIGVSLDGDRLFVADAAATMDDDASVGAIVSLASGGGEPSIVGGTAGYAPRGLAIARVQDSEQLYFTGRDPETGRAGVFRVAPAGGKVEAIGPEVELEDPAGIAVAETGDVYVLDALASQGLASVVRIRDGEGEAILERIGAGFPAGIALTTDAKTVLVSALDAQTRRDRVYVVDTESLELAYISEPFAEFSEPAGLHRAHEKNIFAWADSEANESGTVYVLAL